MPSDALPDDLETLKVMLLAEQCESERLRQIIKEMQRHRFGRRAETLRLPDENPSPRVGSVAYFSRRARSPRGREWRKLHSPIGQIPCHFFPNQSSPVATRLQVKAIKSCILGRGSEYMRLAGKSLATPEGDMR